MNPIALEKLPKWAQKRIRDLESALAVSQRTMSEFCDSQTPSRVWYDVLVCDAATGGPSSRRVYLQTGRVTFGCDDGRQQTLTVSCDRDDKDAYRIDADGMRIKPIVSNSIEIKVGER